MGWTSGFEIKYGELAGGHVPNCPDMRRYCNFATFGRDAVNLNVQFAEDTRYPIQYKRDMTDYVAYCYFPLFLGSTQSGWFGFDIKTTRNNRGEWQLDSKFKILDLNYNTLFENQFVNIGGFNEAYRTGMFFTVGHYIYDNDKNVWAFGLWEQRNAPAAGVTFVGFSENWGDLATYGYPHMKEKTTSPEFGPAAIPDGGYNEDAEKKGTFDTHSDVITPSPAPTLSPLISNFFHAYVVTESSMMYLADAMFPDFNWTSTDLVTIMGEVGQAIFYNKQIDYLLDLLILPIAVPHGNWEHIKVGGKELKTVISGTDYFINGQPASSCYVDVDCGSLTIDGFWASWLDFTGTRVKLFLPYVGFVDIQPEYIIDGTLHVQYRFNIVDGSFIVFLRASSGCSELADSLIGQYAGVAAMHVPLQSLDYSTKISGLISAIGTVAAGAASGGIGAAAAAGAGANVANTMVQKPGSTHANGYNASSSFLSHRQPYVIIERQTSQFSECYPQEVGLPLNAMFTLSALHGLTICKNPKLNFTCTEEEAIEIKRALQEGVIL